MTSSSITNNDINNNQVSTTMISTHSLLSTLIHCTLHGTQTISSIARGNDNNNNGGNSSLQIQYKVAGDARSALTVADTAAQRVIVSSLMKHWGATKLNVVGEEDESVGVEEESALVLEEGLIDRVGLKFYLPNNSDDDEEEIPPEMLDMKHLVLYVDPLDGTREFVEGRLDNVQCLIGACYKGKPIMGCCGLPFPTKKSSTKEEEEGDDAHGSTTTEVVYGLVGKGVGKAAMLKESGEIVSCDLPMMKRFHPGQDNVLSISSGDSSSIKPAVELAKEVFTLHLKKSVGGGGGGATVQHQIVGASGNKILQVAYGKSTVCVQHDKTSLWDTAAPTAILASLGGKVTDYFGDPLIYDKMVLGNKLGVIASAPGAEEEHLLLVKAMRGDKKCLGILEKYGLNVQDDAVTTHQCVDIVRDLQGYPLPVQYFADKLNAPDSTSYSCPESDAVRGLMSNACRIHLHPSGTTAFYKRIIFETLSHAREKMKSAPHKLVRDVNSYKVETSFLSSKACKSVIETAGLHIPKCFDATLEPNDDSPIKSKFSVLLEDLSPSDGWSQRWLLQDEDECKATLTTFAKLHAFFWHGSSFWKDEEAAQELEAGVWDSASYTQPKLQTLNQCRNVAKGWASSKLKCEKELSAFEYWDNLGTRLESIAEENGNLAHPFAEEGSIFDEYKQYRTMCHGDPKQANLFFRSDGAKIDVGLIDFQWSGFGLAATDIAHFITAAVHADKLNDGGEGMLLRYYFDQLQKYLVEYGVYSSTDDAAEGFSYETFMRQYETGVLDMCRLVIAYAWARFEPVDKDDEAGCARTMNKNSYNKSLPNVVWLMNRCDEIMKSRGI